MVVSADLISEDYSDLTSITLPQVGVVWSSGSSGSYRPFREERVSYYSETEVQKDRLT